MVKISWTFQAKGDLINIADFIALDSKKYAKIQINRIRERVSILQTHPKSGRIVPEIESPNIRELILGNYRIIYLLKNTNNIQIITIHHSARKLKLALQ